MKEEILHTSLKFPVAPPSPVADTFDHWTIFLLAGTFVIIFSILLLFFYFKRKNTMVFYRAKHVENNTIARNFSFSFILGIISLGVFLVMLLFYFLSGSINSFASPKVSDFECPDTLELTVDENSGSANVSEWIIANNSDTKMKVDKVIVKLNDSVAGIEGLNSSYVSIKGFDGDVYKGLPNSKEFEPSNLKSVFNEESSENLTFDVSGLSIDIIKQLYSKTVFEVDIILADKVVLFPEVIDEFTYDGNFHQPIAEDELERFTLYGDVSAMDSGIYYINMKLEDGYVWEDATFEDKTDIKWVINKLVIEIAWDPKLLYFTGFVNLPNASVNNVVIRDGMPDDVSISVIPGKGTDCVNAGYNVAFASEIFGEDAHNYALPDDDSQRYHRYEILPKEIHSLQFTIGDFPEYTGFDLHAPLTVHDITRPLSEDDYYVLVEDVDYVISKNKLQTNVNIDDNYYLEVKGIGNYSGTYWKSDLAWNIVPKNISNHSKDFSWTVNEEPVYNGMEQFVSVKALDNARDAELTLNDYSISKNASLIDVNDTGPVNVEFSGRGNYTGSVEVEKFWNLQPFVVELSWYGNNKYYDGQVHNVEANVSKQAQYDTKKLLVKGYEIKSENGNTEIKDVDTYTVTPLKLVYEGDISTLNYVFESDPSFTFKIDPRAVYLDWNKDPGNVFTYDAKPHFPTASLVGACKLNKSEEYEQIEVSSYSLYKVDMETQIKEAIDVGDYYSFADGVKYKNSSETTSNYIIAEQNLYNGKFRINPYTFKLNWNLPGNKLEYNKNNYYETVSVSVEETDFLKNEDVDISYIVFNNHDEDPLTEVINAGIYYWKVNEINKKESSSIDMNNFDFINTKDKTKEVIVHQKKVNVDSWVGDSFVFSPWEQLHPTATVDQAGIIEGDAPLSVISYLLYEKHEDETETLIDKEILDVGKYVARIEYVSDLNYIIDQSVPGNSQNFEIIKKPASFYIFGHEDESTPIIARTGIPSQLVYYLEADPDSVPKDVTGWDHTGFFELDINPNNNIITLTPKIVRSDQEFTIKVPGTKNYSDIEKTYFFNSLDQQSITVTVSLSELGELEGEPPSGWSPIGTNSVLFYRKAYEYGKSISEISDEWATVNIKIKDGKKVDYAHKLIPLGIEEGQTELTKNTSFVPVSYPWLDTLSFEQICEASNDIAKNGSNSEFYEQYLFYATDRDATDMSSSKHIWWSNSNGAFRDKDKKINDAITSVDVESCNQRYKCNFVDDPSNGSSPNNFLFLRIIGVNHDYLKDSLTARSGLTFQVIHAIPGNYQASSSAEQWWGNSDLRSTLNSEGPIFTKINENISQRICAVDKYSQQTRGDKTFISATPDTLFMPSYSELVYTKDNSSKDWNDVGRDEYGVQVFTPSEAKTEGYSYEWNWFNEINGQQGGENVALSSLYKCNDGTFTDKVDKVYQRSVGCNDNSNFMYINNDGSTFNQMNGANFSAVAPCFCVGNVKTYRVDINLGDGGYLAPDSKPSGWKKTSSSPEVYSKMFMEDITQSSIISEWDDIEIYNSYGNIFNGWEPEPTDEPISSNLTFTAKWDAGYVVTINLGTGSIRPGTEPFGWVKVSSNRYYRKFEKGTNLGSVISQWDNVAITTYELKDFARFDYDPEQSIVGDIEVNSIWYPWLDTLELSQMYSDSICISSKSPGWESLYDQYMFYIDTDQIWWSRSNGYFRENGINVSSVVTADDVRFCDQRYKCSFEAETGGQLCPNNYLFLRVVGLNHDYSSSRASGIRCGLTLQPIHALRLSYKLQTEEEELNWWGSDSSVRNQLTDGGSIYNLLCDEFKNVIGYTDKYSQDKRSISPDIRVTNDKLFFPSISEISATDTILSDEYSWFNNGIDDNGQQEFDPNFNLSSEGYCYEWYWKHNIQGNNFNTILNSMYLCNDGSLPQNHLFPDYYVDSWSRSVYPKNADDYMTISMNGNLNTHHSSNWASSLLPCFCLTGSDKCTASLSLNGGTIFYDNPPADWTFNEDLQLWQKDFDSGTSYSTILSDWKDVVFRRSPGDVFIGITPNEGTLLWDQTFSVQWEVNYNVIVEFSGHRPVAGQELPDWDIFADNVWRKQFKEGSRLEDCLSEWKDIIFEYTPEGEEEATYWLWNWSKHQGTLDDVTFVFVPDLDYSEWFSAYHTVKMELEGCSIQPEDVPLGWSKDGDNVYKKDFINGTSVSDANSEWDLNKIVYDDKSTNFPRFSINDGVIEDDMSIKLSCYTLLDNLTIEQISEAAADIQANSQSSKYYRQYLSYIENNDIWWCNSNGYFQRKNIGPYDIITSQDVVNCNQKYKSNFVPDSPDNLNPNNYTFFRIIGINHDYVGNDNSKSGLTFQFIHALPLSYSFSTTPGAWWGSDNSVRNWLNDREGLLKQLNTNISSLIIDTSKFSQDIYSQNTEIAKTNDKLFLPSYAEMCYQNNDLSQISWYNNGLDASGEQIFDPDNPKSEGYCYEWSKYNQIDGKDKNLLLSSLLWCNNGDYPEGVTIDSGLLRSIYYWNYSNCLGSSVYGNIEQPVNYNDYSATVPCFCFGSTNDVVLNTNISKSEEGYVCNPPAGWELVDDDTYIKYKKTFSTSVTYDDLYNEWYYQLVYKPGCALKGIEKQDDQETITYNLIWETQENSVELVIDSGDGFPLANMSCPSDWKQENTNDGLRYSKLFNKNTKYEEALKDWNSIVFVKTNKGVSLGYKEPFDPDSPISESKTLTVDYDLNAAALTVNLGAGAFVNGSQKPDGWNNIHGTNIYYKPYSTSAQTTYNQAYREWLAANPKILVATIDGKTLINFEGASDKPIETHSPIENAVYGSNDNLNCVTIDLKYGAIPADQEVPEGWTKYRSFNIYYKFYENNTDISTIAAEWQDKIVSNDTHYQYAGLDITSGILMSDLSIKTLWNGKFRATVDLTLGEIEEGQSQPDGWENISGTKLYYKDFNSGLENEKIIDEWKDVKIVCYDNYSFMGFSNKDGYLLSNTTYTAIWDKYCIVTVDLMEGDVDKASVPPTNWTRVDNSNVYQKHFAPGTPIEDVVSEWYNCNLVPFGNYVYNGIYTPSGTRYIVKDTSIYALWSPAYTVIVDLNNGWIDSEKPEDIPIGWTMIDKSHYSKNYQVGYDISIINKEWDEVPLACENPEYCFFGFDVKTGKLNSDLTLNATWGKASFPVNVNLSEMTIKAGMSAPAGWKREGTSNIYTKEFAYGKRYEDILYEWSGVEYESEGTLKYDFVKFTPNAGEVKGPIEFKAVCYLWLDYYSFENLQIASIDITTYGTQSQYYDQFMYYAKTGQIWWSNSYGYFRSKGYDENSVVSDQEAYLNCRYKCNFDKLKDGPDANSVNNYLFMRVVGVNHDYVEGNKSQRIGITMQPIHALPIAYGMSSNSWWGDESQLMRTRLQKNGDIFESLHDDIKSKVVPADKYSQSMPQSDNNILCTSDMLFLPSYSEMFVNGKTEDFNYEWYDNGLDEHNQQIFNPNEPATEGYTYEWSVANNITSDKTKSLLKSLFVCNDGTSPHGLEELDDNKWWTRTLYKTLGWFVDINNEGKAAWSQFDKNFAIAPCLGLGSYYYQQNTVTIDFSNVDIRSGSIIPEGWERVEGENKYQKSFYKGSQISSIVDEWKNIDTISPDYYEFGGFDTIDGILYEDLTIHTVFYPWLDTLNMDDLVVAADDISANGENSIYYRQFKFYVDHDEIWYSNSNGYFRKDKKWDVEPTVTFDDVTHCNQIYKCDFVQDVDPSTGEPSPHPNNFLFLRILGLNHDYKEGNTLDRAGLTFQTINSLPIAYQFNSYNSSSDDTLKEDSSGSWWGDKEKSEESHNLLRTVLNKDVIECFSPYVKENIINVKKYSQSVRQSDKDVKETLDKLFIPSYSESVAIPATKGLLITGWNKNGVDENGKQIFDPKICDTEGYCYEWAWSHNIDGGQSDNEILANLSKANDGSIPLNAQYLRAWTRTINANLNSGFCGVNIYGSYDPGNRQEYVCWESNFYSCAPCFCLGSTKETYTVSVNLEGGYINEDTPGSKELLKNWKRVSSSNVYQRSFNVNDPISDVYSQWEKADLECNLKHYDFGGFDEVDGTIQHDITLNAQWYPWIDTLGFDQINQAAVDISTYGEKSAFYKQYKYYATDRKHNHVWYSHSGGYFREKGYKESDPVAKEDIKYCDPAYKNNFRSSQPGFEDLEYLQYLFLRVIGVYHDYVGDADEEGNIQKAGLTFQTAHSYLDGLQASRQKDAAWNNFYLRNVLNSSILNMFNTEISNKIVPARKYYQSKFESSPNIDCSLTDSLFIPSYSETYRTNPIGTYTWQENGRDDKGNQIFDVNNPLTEGYCYDWYWAINCDGIRGSSALSGLRQNNLGNKPNRIQSDNYGTLLRTFCTISSSLSSGQYFGFGVNNNYSGFDYNVVEAVNPCFCVGVNNSLPTYKVTMDLDGGQIEPGSNPPSNWQKEDDGKYSKIVYRGTWWKDIVSQWEDTSIYKQGYIKDWYKTTSGEDVGEQNLTSNTDFKINWSNSDCVDVKVEVPQSTTIAEFSPMPNGWHLLNENKTTYVKTLDKNTTYGDIKTEWESVVFVDNEGYYLDYAKFDVDDSTVVYSEPVGVVAYKWLDCLSIDEISSASQGISTDGVNSIYYDQFKYYIDTDQIWWSNGNGYFRKAGKTAESVITSQDILNAGCKYKCNFVKDTEDSPNPNNYIFLRILDLQHDILSGNTDKKAGITVQSVHAIPISYQMADNDSGGAWWGDQNCLLRNALQSESPDSLYSMFNYDIKKNIVKVQKYSQTQVGAQEGINDIKITDDNLFVPSYSEYYGFEQGLTNSWNGNGIDEDGNPIFEPDRPNSEGYCYKWNYVNSVSGKSSNAILAQQYRCNDGTVIQNLSNNRTWLRTLTENPEEFSVIDVYGYTNTYAKYNNYFSVCPCFALADTKVSVTVDLNEGNLARNVDPPAGWNRVGITNTYQKQVAVGTDFVDINDVWAHLEFECRENYCFCGFDKTSGIIEHDTTIRAVWREKLDYLTLEKLGDIAKDIEVNGESSYYYPQVWAYIYDDQIWWSNSNGYFDQSGITVDSAVTSYDVAFCNQDYKCSFNDDVDGELNPNNYLFLRIIGINHDYKPDGTLRCGLTFQAVHALQDSWSFSQQASDNWESSYLRDEVMNDKIYNSLAQPFKNLIADKKTFYSNYGDEDVLHPIEIKSSIDKLFVPSYSENYWIQKSIHSSDWRGKFWHLNGRDSKDGHQVFNPQEPQTEGYCYEWYWINSIYGDSLNIKLMSMSLCNDGKTPGEGLGFSWQRSAWTDTWSYIAYNSGYVDKYSKDKCGVNICFCFG